MTFSIIFVKVGNMFLTVYGLGVFTSECLHDIPMAGICKSLCLFRVGGILFLVLETAYCTSFA